MSGHDDDQIFAILNSGSVEDPTAPKGAEPIDVAEAVPDAVPDDVGEPPVEAESDEQPREQQRIVIGSSDAASDQPDIDGSGTTDLIDKLAQDFDQLRGEIWAAIREDRQQLDKFIKMFEERIADPDDVRSFYVKAIASLLSTKVTTSMRASQLLDSVARMVSAIKNAERGDEALDLSKLLGQDEQG